MSTMTCTDTYPKKIIFYVALLCCCGFMAFSMYFTQGSTYTTLIQTTSNVVHVPDNAIQHVPDSLSMELLHERIANFIPHSFTSIFTENQTDRTAYQIHQNKQQIQIGKDGLVTLNSNELTEGGELQNSQENGQKLLTKNRITETDVDYNVRRDADKIVRNMKEPDCLTNNINSISFNSIYGHDLLLDTLEKKLAAVKLKKVIENKTTCDTDFKLGNSCDNNKCLQKQLPNNPLLRVVQLSTPCNLQMSQEQHKILREMADEVKGTYDIVLLTAASSNHFLESQALLKSLHENVFPYLQNFVLLLYNLGFTDHERLLMVKYCKCQVLDFPFHKFPNFMINLKCYTWKPVLIKAHLQKAGVVFWMDASIRFYNSSSDLLALIQKAKDRGILIPGSSAESSFRTYRSMYHFFGDEPCAYLSLCQGQATYGVYHREYFVDRVILEPWVACALNKDCMCPSPNISADCEDSKRMAEEYYKGTGPIIYGMCHRFDQSAINLILHKLYQDLHRWVMVSASSLLRIRRKDTLVYFPSE